VKVILLTDVERLGARGEVVTVRAGYARNFLFPRKLALKATTEQLAQLDRIRAQLASREARITKRLADRAERLGLVTVKTTIKMGATGAFGTITNADIAELLTQAGHPVDKHQLVLTEPIKTPGVYDVVVRLGHAVSATVKLWVVEEPACSK